MSISKFFGFLCFWKIDFRDKLYDEDEILTSFLKIFCLRNNQIWGVFYVYLRLSINNIVRGCALPWITLDLHSIIPLPLEILKYSHQKFNNKNQKTQRKRKSSSLFQSNTYISWQKIKDRMKNKNKTFT